MSTPIWEYRDKYGDKEDSPSPGHLPPSLNFSGGSFQSPNTSDNVEEKLTTRTAGMSPLLRRLLVTPNDEDEYTEMKRLLIETVNLTRAALESGLIKENSGEVALTDPIDENPFFKPLGRIDPSSKNSLFTPWKRRDSLSCLLGELDINAWEMDDLMIEYEFNKSIRRGCGVLLVDDGFLNNSIILDTEDKIDAYVNEVLAESHWAVVKRRVGLAATVTPSSKRTRTELRSSEAMM